MKKIAVIIYGPPGSGKGTQANLLAQKMGLIHFDTGKYLESIVHDPLRQKDKIIQRERRNFDTGKLITPSFVYREVSKAAKKIGKAELGIVLSGSPRTVYEAEKFMPILAKLYGRKNIFVFEFQLPPQISIKRNSSRLVCGECGYTLLTAYYPKVRPIRYGKLSHGVKPKFCPVCGGHFYKRSLDKPEVIKVRLLEYKKRTEPVFKVLEKYGYRVKPFDARPAPHKVLRKIVRLISKKTR